VCQKGGAGRILYSFLDLFALFSLVEFTYISEVFTASVCRVGNQAKQADSKKTMEVEVSSETSANF
jgi:hypothetical protein